MKFIADKLTAILSSTYLHETCFVQTCKLNLNFVQLALKSLAGIKAFKMINFVCIHILKKVPKSWDLGHFFSQ